MNTRYPILEKFSAETIYIIPPYNNHVRFHRVWPEIETSRAIIEFLEGQLTDKKWKLNFTADCHIVGDHLIVTRSDFGQKWKTQIPLSSIKIDINFS